MKQDNKPSFETAAIKKIMVEEEISPMDLVRMCNIAVSSAYKINGEQLLTDLTVIYKVYIGLKNAGFEVTWNQITGIE